MSRRKGQNPKVRVGERADGTKYFFFQYWLDVAGQEERKRMREVVGLCSQMTKSEAELRKLEFFTKLGINSSSYQIPSAHKFGQAAKHYVEKFGPAEHRDSTRSVWESRLNNHLLPDWKDTPIDLITFSTVKEWAAKKHMEGHPWSTVKDWLRTMQRVISAFSPDQRVPFTQRGLVPKKVMLEEKRKTRKKESFSWEQAVKIAEHFRVMDGLGSARAEQYATLVLLAEASGLRGSELLGLRCKNVNFTASTITVEEASDQRTRGKVGLCKNDRAYRTVLLADAEGEMAMAALRRFMGNAPDPNALVFHSKRGNPLLQTTILKQALHPALKALGIPRAGFHAFRRGCNRRWELAGINAAVIRQQMGHSSAAMTVLYTGEIPITDVVKAFSKASRKELEIMENGVAA